MAAALASLNARGAALASALAAAGHPVAVTQTQLATIRTQAQQGLPATLVSRLTAVGASPAAFLQAFNAALAKAPSTLTFSQILGAPAPTAAYRAANHSITVAALSAIVGALGQQHAISTSARATMSADLLAPKLKRNEPRDRAHAEWAKRVGLLG